MINTEARILGFNFPIDGLKARNLYLEGKIKDNSKYFCFYCNVELVEVNIEKSYHYKIEKSPYFRTKSNILHERTCQFYHINIKINEEIEQTKYDKNNKEIKKLILPKINPDTLEVEIIKSINKSSNSKSNIPDHLKHELLSQREVISSTNKIEYFVEKYSEIFYNNPNNRFDILMKKNIELSNSNNENYNSFINISKNVNIYDVSKKPKIYWTYISNKIQEFNNKYEFCLDVDKEDNVIRKFVIYKDHLLNKHIKNHNIFIYTIPVVVDNQIIFTSLGKNLTHAIFYWKYKNK